MFTQCILMAFSATDSLTTTYALGYKLLPALKYLFSGPPPSLELIYNPIKQLYKKYHLYDMFIQKICAIPLL